MQDGRCVKTHSALLMMIVMVASAIVVIWDMEETDAAIGDAFSEGVFDYEIVLETPATVKVRSLNDPSVTDLNIPDTVTYNSKQYMVTEIEKNAFKNNMTITSVTIPQYVTIIGSAAFDGCKNVTVCNFNAASCGNLTSTYSLKGLGNSSDLTLNIGAEVTKIPEYLFYGSYALKEIHMGPKVESIGKSAFSGCVNNTTLDLSIATKLMTIDNYAFNENKKLMDVDLDAIPVTYIGESAFAKCYEIKTLYFHSSINTLGSNAFENCSKVNSVYYDIPTFGSTKLYAFRGMGSSGDGMTITFGPSVREIPDYLFLSSSGVGYVKNKIVTVNLSDKITKIGDGAFKCAYDLTNITIPDSVTSIGEDAFYGCGLTSITIPENVTTIGNWAFYNCYKLTTIYYNAKNCTTSYPFGTDSGSERAVTVGDKVQVIPANCFTSNSRVTSITIPGNVTTIAEKAFYQNYGMKNISLLGSPKVGSDAFKMSYKSGYSTYKATCNIYAIVDQAYFNLDSVGTYNFMQLPHVELDLSGTTITENPTGWGQYSGKLYRYYESGQTISLPTIEAVGKKFEGWTPSTGGTMGTSTLIFTANWSVAHTVTYNTNGGTACPSVSVKEGDVIPLPSTTRTGYDLSGWSIPAGTVMGTSDMTVSANWTPKTVTVTFMSEGNVVTTKTGQYGNTLTAPTTTREGYTLIGWSNFTGKYPAIDTTCVAQWGEGGPEKYSHKVTYNTNGGTACSSVMVKEGDVIPLPTTTREGYTFKGWSIPEGTVMGKSDVTVTASWESSKKMVYIEFYDSNNKFIDRWAGEAGKYITNATPTLPDKSSTEKFVGWTNYTGYFPEKDTKYYPSYAKTGTTTPEVPVTYGKYNVKVVSKTILSDGTKTYDSGSTVSGGGYYDKGAKVTIKATPALGYKFVSWNDGNKDSTRTITVNNDVTYTASFMMMDPYETGKEIGEGIVNLIMIGIAGFIILVVAVVVIAIRHR